VPDELVSKLTALGISDATARYALAVSAFGGRECVRREGCVADGDGDGDGGGGGDVVFL
jgi:hypothetical protein